MFMMVSKLEDVSDALSSVQLSSNSVPDELCFEGDMLCNYELKLFSNYISKT